MKSSITIRNVSKHYPGGESWAVRSVTLSVFPGEVTVLMGPSGSGKTTLLSMIGGVLTPTSGELNVCGAALERCDEKQLQLFRRKQIGFIFQSFNLLASLTALENIEVAFRCAAHNFPRLRNSLNAWGWPRKPMRIRCNSPADSVSA